MKNDLKLRQSLFWDVDPKTIDFKKHAKYIIERVLDFGDDQEVRWVGRRYSPRLLKRVIQTSRVLRPETRNLWSLILKRK